MDSSNPSDELLAASENPRATSLQSVSLQGPSRTPSCPAEQPSQQKQDPDSNPAVQFAFNVEIISPEAATRPTPKDGMLSTPNKEMEHVSQSLRDAHIQERRMSIFTFEPYSLPPSRIQSKEDQSRGSSRQTSRSTLGQAAPLHGSRTAEMQSPPLTPAGTNTGLVRSPDDVATKTDKVQRGHDANAITPQVSSSHGGQSPFVGPEGSESLACPSSGSQSEPVPFPDEPDRILPPHRRGMFSVGPRSVPVSRESSPSRLASQFYSRPLTPSGDRNDPYAATKRAPQDHKNIDPRFVFGRKKKGSPSSTYMNLAKSARNVQDQGDKRRSVLGALAKPNRSNELEQSDSATPNIHSRQSSMAELKRFLKGAAGGSHSKKGSLSTTSSVRGKSNATPKLAHQIPFGDDYTLTSKWGRLGKVLGSGAGGSVRLMKRSEDGTVFAVKEFRPRHSYESEKDYVKKLTAEFCIGSTLHHGNIIETLDIVSEKGKWYEVMEYAPFDLFAIVMTGKMSRAEITCCWLQILSGVTYLHSMGLAHRDLKLDNVVVNEHGIMKIIDFGSAHVFQYSFETTSVPASGIVGSDPYLAPEVYDEKKYDAAAVDIWSLAISFCCMSLRRFPWKLPRPSDNSFKLYTASPTLGHDPEMLAQPSPVDGESCPSPSLEIARASKRSIETKGSNRTSNNGSGTGEAKKEVIRGPWRLLRLLPRESRHIIYRMLQVDPNKRIKMAEILEEPWIVNTVICREVGLGKVLKADGHTHILEPPVNSPET